LSRSAAEILVIASMLAYSIALKFLLLRSISGPLSFSAHIFWPICTWYRTLLLIIHIVRNQIYDEILPPNSGTSEEVWSYDLMHPQGFCHSKKIVTRCVGSYIGKSFHADALYSGDHPLPRGLLYRMKLGSDLFNEILDRWCCTVSFQLVESFELDIQRLWLGLRGGVPKCSSSHLGRHVDPDTQHIFPELDTAVWFLRMRKCYFQLNLFSLRSLLRNGKDGIENFRSCLTNIANILKRVTTLKNLRIDVVLWPQKMPSVRERERPKFVNTDDLNYRWVTSEKDYFASNLETCFDPLKEVPGIQTIRVYGGNLIDAWWKVEEPDIFQFRIPSLLPTVSSQRHFIPTM
jgi:hypothetical protein